MYSTDASSGPQEFSKDKFMKNNTGIRNLHPDELFYLEKDLDFYEKVFQIKLNFSTYFFFHIEKEKKEDRIETSVLLNYFHEFIPTGVSGVLVVR